MAQTYYRVTYYKVGHGKTNRLFKSKEDALKFYNSNEFADKPVAHVASNAKTISKFEEEYAMQDPINA